MFIDVTRHGGGRVLRVAASAIAYLDACEGGTALHLVGGETLRVSETPAEIEQRATAQLAGAELVAAPQPTLEEIMAAVGHAYQAQVAAAAAAPVLRPSATRKGR